MATESSEFATELRGYKRSDVDEVLADLRGELIKASRDRARALEELKTLQEELTELKANFSESNAPTYAGLGGRLEAVLRIAEEQSTRIIAQADIDAERTIGNARDEAKKILEESERESTRLLADAEAQASAVRESAQEKADALVSEAQAHAERVREEAIEEAASIRGSIATEVARMRTTAKRETDALRAEVKREVAELKVVADRELNEARKHAANLKREIDVERATHELTLKKIQEEAALAKTTMEHELAATHAKLQHDNDTQAERLALEAASARADLDIELQARRAEAERELLEAHQKAVELNSGYLREAEAQLDDLKKRIGKLREEHKSISDAIIELSTTGKADSQAEARTIIEEANKKAKIIIKEATLAAEEQVAQAEKHLVELRAERETIAGYIESLRKVVQGIEAGATTKKR